MAKDLMKQSLPTTVEPSISRLASARETDSCLSRNNSGDLLLTVEPDLARNPAFCQVISFSSSREPGQADITHLLVEYRKAGSRMLFRQVARVRLKWVISPGSSDCRSCSLRQSPGPQPGQPTSACC